MATLISRRSLLRAAGTSSLALMVGACTNDDGPFDREPTLTLIVATFEVLTGPTGRIPFGILDPEQQPLLDRDVQLWVMREGEVVSGPIDPLFYGEGLGQRGIYVADVDLDQGGLYDVLVQVDGGAVGTSVFSARTPEESTSYAPGTAFPVIVTPTEDDPGALETLCTREPPCSMHETSLDTALGTGPVVFTVATPRFCQTAVCGPVVDVVEEFKDRAPDGVTFIHAEVYNDAGVTPSSVIDELALPSEPWTWVIDAEGVVVDRFDGPVVPSLLEDAVARA